MAGMHLIYRGIMNSLIDVASVIPACVKEVNEEGITIQELIEYDFIGFFLFLCTADFVISDPELTFLNCCYPKEQSREEWMEIAQENKWIRGDYLTELPASFPLFVEADNFLFDSNSSRAGALTKAFYESFESLGDTITICEGRINEATGRALNDFQFMLRGYIERHAKWL